MHCKPAKFNKRLNLSSLLNCLESLKFFVVNLLVHCMHGADQNSFSLKFPVVKRSVFGNSLNLYIRLITFQVYSSQNRSVFNVQTHVFFKKYSTV